MAEAWGTVSAGRDCKDCSDHHIVLSDRQNGKESGNPEATMVLLGMGGIQALFAYVFTDNLSTAMIIWGLP